MIVPGLRKPLSFRAVNRRNVSGFDAGMQRHHFLPRQLLGYQGFARMFDAIDKRQIGFEDFRENGLLLPSNDAAALRSGLPLHCGPHHRYNGMVMSRVGQVESHWASRRSKDSDAARSEALMRLHLLKRALHRCLLDTSRRKVVLNCRNPLGKSIDFAELDAMADLLWGETKPATS